MEERLNQMRANNTTKRDIAIAVSCQGFYKTGLMTDIVQVTCFDQDSSADKSSHPDPNLIKLVGA
jgi:hypothetical protein